MANTMKITVENEDVLTHAVVNGIDTSNEIATPTAGTELNITQDCVLCARLRSANVGDTNIKLNGTSVMYLPNDGHQGAGVFYLKKGDKLLIQGSFWAFWAKIFGVKR